MATVITHQEEQDKKKGVATSVMIHIALLVLALLPLISFPDPPPGQSGIVVALGEPDRGQGDELPSPPPAEAVEEEAPAEVEEVEEPEPEPVKEVKPKPQPEESKKVNVDKNSKELALKKAKEKKAREEKLKKQRAEDAKKKAEDDAKKKIEAEKKRKAAAAAKKKAEAEAARKAEQARKDAEAKKLKDGIAGAFNSGGGQGNNGTSGSQGDPNGDPSSKVLDGISTGTGKIGGGLENRGGKGPALRDKSQETGRIVVKVCVDGNGRVTSAKYTQRGSTSSSRNLIKLAESNARKYKFDKGSVDKQCGTITYNFKFSK